MSDLVKEVRYLHQAFFQADAPSEVVERYIAASEACGQSHSDLMDIVVGRELDAEAIEFVLRVRKGPAALTKKIRILFYLVEVRSDYFGFFIGEEESRPRAAWGLAKSILQSAVKYVKGTYLISRHGLV